MNSQYNTINTGVSENFSSDNENIFSSTYKFNYEGKAEIRRKNLEDKFFSPSIHNVIRIISLTNKELAEDLKISAKNFEILIQKLVEINNEGNNELTNIARDFTVRITTIYENFAKSINAQLTENIKLKLEIDKEMKENDALKSKVQLLTKAVYKLENIIGAEQS